MNKRFWHYNFPFSRSLRVWKMRIEWQFCTRDEVEGVNLSRDSQFFERNDSVKTEIYSGKTLRPANLSNEYNRMLFLIFCFPQMCGKQVKKNKMDNSQNGYSSVGKTGKIKKKFLPSVLPLAKLDFLGNLYSRSRTIYTELLCIV